MRMLLKGSLLALGVAGFLMAQHGGGGGGHHGGGGFSAGGGFSSGGGFHHYSSPATTRFSGTAAVIPPPSYSGHLTFSTPGMGTTGAYRSSSRLIEVRPSWGRPPIRLSGAGYNRYRGFYGIGYYPFLGYGYYNGDDFYSPYYDSAPDQQYYAPYEQGPDTGADYYPPVPHAYPPEPQQGPMPVVQVPDAPTIPITIVLKNGQTMIVQNYAIMNGLFWDFSKQNAKKIPLSEIDVEASAKATDAAGGAFPAESFAANPR